MFVVNDSRQTRENGKTGIQDLKEVNPWAEDLLWPFTVHVEYEKDASIERRGRMAWRKRELGFHDCFGVVWGANEVDVGYQVSEAPFTAKLYVWVHIWLANIEKVRSQASDRFLAKLVKYVGQQDAKNKRSNADVQITNERAYNELNRTPSVNVSCLLGTFL